MELELGSLLKNAREKKDLSIDDIQEKTKIRKKYIEAIEKNEFDILPGNVYLKVFVKGYAREVGLNYQELLANYEILNIEEKRESNLNKDYLDGAKISHSSNKSRNKKGPFKIILIILLTLFLTAALLYTYQYFSDSDLRLLGQQNQKEESKVEEAEIIDLETDNSSAQIEEKEIKQEKSAELNKISEVEKDLKIGQLSNTKNSQDSKVQNSNNSQVEDGESKGIDSFLESELELEENSEIIIVDENDKNNLENKAKNLENGTIENETDNQKSSVESTQNMDVENNSNLSDEPEANLETANSSLVKDKDNENNELKKIESNNSEVNSEQQSLSKNLEEIILNAADIVWLRVRADGENLFSGMLENNEQVNFDFKENLYLKIGNGSAITATIEGKQYGPWAKSGEIAEIEIIKEEGELKFNNLRD